MIELLLPFPPSVNGLYAGKGRRYKSKEYVQWCAQAGGAIFASSIVPHLFKEPLHTIYTFSRPDKRKRDVENYCKAISDLLVDRRVISDDSLIGRLVAEWSDMVGEDIKPGTVRIRIEPLKMAAKTDRT